ncbi:MAG TPA: cytochrome c biogenesis protein CcdA [Thermoanaerobaculia bacterium]|nr:cytochrome c biogenesis protein CcdA [Thermoanaerobaculia bacterium]
MRSLPALLAALLLAPTANAQVGFGGGVDAGPKVTITGALHQRDGDAVEGVVTAKIAEGWHINSARPLDEWAIPTELTLDPATATMTGAAYPQHKMEAFSFSGDSEIAVYDGTIRIPFTATLAPGSGTIRASLRYQACNDNVCLPPADAVADIDATAVGAPPPQEGAGFVPLSAAPRDARPAAEGDRLSRAFASSGLPLTLLILFIGGLALNLTPCVLPVIPITLGFFAMQSDGRRSRRFALSAMYVLGLVVMYSALGVMAAIGGQMFGAWLQQPAVLVGFAVLMLVLASSMFGAFEIQPPQWIASRSQGRAGLAGAATMGLFVGIVAAPCVGPVVISLLTLVAAIGKPLIGGVMFAALAFGLGFPYLALLNVLPRPGEWMVQVKKAMGFVLVAMAFYFLRPLTGDEVFRWGVVVALLVGAIYLFTSRGTAGRAMRLACASVLLIASAAFAIPRAPLDGVVWERYEDSSVNAAAAAKQPVVIDFYADWCLPCKELDQKTFSDPRVKAEMDRFTRLKADLTLAGDAKTERLSRQFNVVGVPTIVFLDAQGREQRSIRLTGFEGPEAFLDRLKQVR